MVTRALPHTIVRYDREAHAPYVRESWALAARHDRREIDWWLRRVETRAVVALVPGDGEPLILGWAVAVPDEQVIVWVQVKKLWWHRGLGRRLAMSAVSIMRPASHFANELRYAYPSRIAERIAREHPGALRFDPTLARRVPRASDWMSPGEVPNPDARR